MYPRRVPGQCPINAYRASEISPDSLSGKATYQGVDGARHRAAVSLI
jgi:hypothetical protein